MIAAPCSIMEAIVAAASPGSRSAIHITVVPPLGFATACADAFRGDGEILAAGGKRLRPALVFLATPPDLRSTELTAAAGAAVA